MEALAVLFRSLQFYAHNAHNLTKGQSFFADHSFLGDLYGTYESDYDSCIERLIGLGKTPNLPKILEAATEHCNSKPDKDFFTELLRSEKALCNLAEHAMQGASQGTVNMLADMADRSEQRQYKLQQRLKA